MEYADADGKVRRHTHPWHDCAYVKVRNKLIPEAARGALVRDADGKSTRLHTERFMAEMDRLWAASRDV